MTKRVISAIIMVVIFVPFLLIGDWPFTVVMSLLSVMGLYELLHIRESKKDFPKFIDVESEDEVEDNCLFDGYFLYNIKCIF